MRPSPQLFRLRRSLFAQAMHKTGQWHMSTVGRRCLLRTSTSSLCSMRVRCLSSNTRIGETDPSNNTIIESSAAEKDRPKQHHFSKTKAYLDLAKAKLSALVVATTAAGFVAAGGPISTQMDVLVACVVGTTLCSSSAAALNQIFEADRDARMKRTQQRPLVTGALTMQEATIAATTWGVAGTSLLAIGTDPVTTALGAGNIALYSGLYTYMKRVSIYNTWVGAVVGAIPPVMGWTAATGGSLLDAPALLLGSTLYLWQMPHFFALSYMHRLDYKRGDFQMLPVLEEDGERTAGVIVRYAWYLSAVPIVATLTDVTSSMFALEGLVLNGYALSVAHRFQRERTNANARKIFLTSLWYLPSLLVLFLIHSKVWDEDKEEDDAIAKFLSDRINEIRNKGREMCVHEAVVNHTLQGEKSCPVVVGSKEGSKQVEKASVVAVATADTVSSSLCETSAKTN